AARVQIGNVGRHLGQAHAEDARFACGDMHARTLEADRAGDTVDARPARRVVEPATVEVDGYEKAPISVTERKLVERAVQRQPRVMYARAAQRSLQPSS